MKIPQIRAHLCGYLVVRALLAQRLVQGGFDTARAAMSDTVEVKAVKSAITAKNSQLIFLGDHEMTPADWSAPWFVI